MMTEGIKSSRLVERSVNITAAPADVWRAIVDPEIARQWMGMRIACSWEVGSTVTLTETPLGRDYTEHGTLLTFEPGRGAVFRVTRRGILTRRDWPSRVCA